MMWQMMTIVDDDDDALVLPVLTCKTMVQHDQRLQEIDLEITGYCYAG